MKTQIFFLFLLALCFQSCDSFVAVDLPDSQLTGANVFKDRTTVNAAMVDVYSKLRDNGLLTGSLEGISVNLGLYADELSYYGPSGNSAEFRFNNSLIDSDSSVLQIWNASYNQIYSANAIIAGVENSVALKETDKNHFKGEALFVRALVHFYLVNLFGGIPYIKTTDYEQNRLVHRMPVDAVYAAILTDLNQAVSLLPETYVTAERVRPNRATAYALLSRVYLYAGSWPEASNAASAVLNNSMYIWEGDLDKIFLKESTATIWQFKPKTEGGNTDEGDSFNFITGPPPNVALSSTLLSSFSSADQRKVHWTAAVTDGTTTWYHANKYKQSYGAPSSIEYSIVFRLAEQYLIRAEARAQQGDLIGAKEDLNKIRHTAGLGDTPAVTANEIIAAVLQERRLEFFTEYGQRFFDLKRTGRLDEVLSISKPRWDSHDALWPIPATEILANPNLHPQNLGY